MPGELHASQISIPARVLDDGRLTFFYGGPMPRLAPGSIIEIIVPEYAVQSEFHLNLLGDVQLKEMFRAGTTLIAQVGDSSARLGSLTLDGEHIRAESEVILNGKSVIGVELHLLEPLSIYASVGKPSTLKACRCQIPALGSVARSLNEAYTWISQKYEPKRRSHTGNVFDKMYFFDSRLTGTRQIWYPLRERRLAVVAEMEDEVVHQALPWWYCSGGSLYSGMWAYLNAPGDLWASIQLVKPSEITLLETPSLVVGNLEFETRVAALAWLRLEGFAHMGTDGTLRQLPPPSPPYVTPHGQHVTL